MATDPPPELSAVVAGCWRLAEWGWSVAERLRWIDGALDLGVSSFDHAEIYGGYTVEGLFGEALAAAPGLRNRLQIITKCGIKLVAPARPAHAAHAYDTSTSHVVASVEQSLGALRTDRIDLLLIHRPDALMDPDELAGCLGDLQRAGKVRSVGVSNHRPSQLSMLHRRCTLVTNQIEFSPLQMGALADGTLDQCTDLGLRPMAWSPLARGRLFESDDEQARRVRSVLEQLAAREGCSPATVAHAWVMRHPSRPRTITGSRRVQALQEAVAAISLRLSPEDWYQVWQASMGHGLP